MLEELKKQWMEYSDWIDREQQRWLEVVIEARLPYEGVRPSRSFEGFMDFISKS